MRWLRDKFEDLTTAVVGGIIAAILGAAAIGTWAIIQSMSGPVTALVFVGGFGGILFSINQLLVMHDRRRRPHLGNPSSSEIENILRDWLYRQGFSVTIEPQQYAHFQLWAQDKTNVKILIAHMKNQEGYLNLGTSFIVLDNEAALRSLTQTVLQTLRLELTRFGINHVGMGDPLDRITVTHLIVLDENLNEYTFAQHVAYVRRAYMLIQLHLEKEQ